ncbi:hypothetical protein K501DRAFT_288146 [Backusella circina FSU 941]|nr:hypothetical protein K501DRAFT_288146 [Backusella circina FSU 941]
MTAEVVHSRSKRRKLPRRNIVDYEYVAPSKNTNIEHNLGLLKSARLRNVLSEVWGEESVNAHRASQPIVIDQQYTTITKKRAMSGTKSLLEKLKEHEKQLDLDLSNVVIIPPSQNNKQSTSASLSSSSSSPSSSTPLATINTNVTVNTIEQKEKLKKAISAQNKEAITFAVKDITTYSHHDTSKQDVNNKNNDDDNGKSMDICTTTLSSPTCDGITTTYSNCADEMMLSEGLKDDQLPDKYLHLMKQQQHSPIVVLSVSEVEGNDKYLTAEEEEDDEEVKKGLQEKEVAPNDKTSNVHGTSPPLPPPPDDLQQETFSPKESILKKWIHTQKNNAKHKMLNMLKQSTALDWVEDGPDLDTRKDNVGLIRKQQLFNKLNKPYLERKKVQKSNWLVSRNK